MAPRKRAAKKQAPKKVVQEQVPEEKQPTHRWPTFVVEKHLKRQQEAREIVAQKVEQKRQRLANNGIPPEKRPI